MGNVLRWLVCVILALGVGALVLAILLFNKRELLVGRTHLLETQLIKVAKTIEAVADQTMKFIDKHSDILSCV